MYECCQTPVDRCHIDVWDFFYCYQLAPCPFCAVIQCNKQDFIAICRIIIKQWPLIVLTQTLFLSLITSWCKWLKDITVMFIDKHCTPKPKMDRQHLTSVRTRCDCLKSIWNQWDSPSFHWLAIYGNINEPTGNTLVFQCDLVGRGQAGRGQGVTVHCERALKALEVLGTPVGYMME